MIYLLLSIFSSVITVSFFNIFARVKVNTFHAIIANYITCVCMGNIIADKPVISTAFWAEPWFPFTVLLGFLFISIFYFIGETSQKLGLSVSMVSAKLSVVMPVSVAVMLHGEHISFVKVAGILLSLLAVFLISNKEEKGNRPGLWLLPVIVFVGSGLIDTFLNYVENLFIPPADAGGIVSTIFLVAFCTGSLIMIFRMISAKEIPSYKSLLWGVALGIPNYFSMFFLVKTLEQFEATHIFPVNNIGIVVGSTLVSIFFFKEKMSPRNWVGFAIALASILVISFA